jgi:hypothetical protein
MESSGNPAPPNRRKFLRHVGMTAAATAALAGITDMAGINPALAASKGGSLKKATLVRAVKTSELTPAQRKRVRTVTGTAQPNVDNDDMFCTCTPGDCGSPCHPSSVWCHYCTKIASSSTCKSGYYCIGGGCTNRATTC